MKQPTVIRVVGWSWLFAVLLNLASAQYEGEEDYDYGGDYAYGGDYTYGGDYSYGGEWSYGGSEESTDSYGGSDYSDYYIDPFYDTSTKSSEVTNTNIIFNNNFVPSMTPDYAEYGNGQDNTRGGVNTGGTGSSSSCACDWSKVPGSVNRFPSYIRNIQNSMLSTFFGGRSQFRKSYPSFMSKYSQKGGSRGQLNWNSINSNFPSRNIRGWGQSSSNNGNRGSSGNIRNNNNNRGTGGSSNNRGNQNLPSRNTGNRGSQQSSGNIRNNNNNGGNRGNSGSGSSIRGNGSNNNRGNQTPSRNTNNRGNSNGSQKQSNSNSNRNNNRGNSGSNSRPSSNRFTGSQSIRNSVPQRQWSSTNQRGNTGSRGPNNSPIRGGSSSNTNNRPSSNIMNRPTGNTQTQKCNCSGSFTSSRAMDRLQNYYGKSGNKSRG